MDPALLPLVYAAVLLLTAAGSAGLTWSAWGRSDAHRDRALKNNVKAALGFTPTTKG